MSLYSGGQLETLVDAFWNRNEVRCPNDGRELVTCLDPQVSGYFLVLVCPDCGKKAQVTRFSDPKRLAFREWTDSEKDALSHDFHWGIDIRCPVCAGPVTSRTLGESVRIFKCVRCGNVA